MSMTTCPECKGSISNEAVYCPHCGYPLSATQSDVAYELELGKPERSGFATFLTVLAVISWVGGLIIAIAGANVTTVSSYSYYSSTEFSFSTYVQTHLSYL